MFINQNVVVNGFGLALDMEPAGQLAGGGEALLNGGLHDGPDFQHVVPNARALVQFHIVGEADIAELAELLDFRKGVFQIDVALLLGNGAAFKLQIPAADAVNPLHEQLAAVF